MKKGIVHGWRSYGKELILLGLLFLPNLAALFLSSDLRDSLAVKVAYLFFAFIIWLFPFLILKTRTVFLVWGLWLIVSPVEIGHLYYMGLSSTPTMLRTILITDWNEAVEMVGSLWVLLIPHLLLCAIYYYGVFHLKNRYLFSGKWRKILIGVFLLFNLVLFGAMWKRAPSEQGIARMETAKNWFLKKYYKVYPFSFFHSAQRVVKNQWKMRAFAEELQSFRFGAVGEKTLQRRIVVWVMGESSRYDHYSLNGYERLTSPELSAIPNLLSYSQMYSEANLTELSLPLFLTRATPQNPELAWKEKTVVDLFSEAGFRTAWIANQSSENLFVARAAGDAGYSYFATVDFDADRNYDGNLLPKIEEQLKKEGDLFILVHFLGSHFRYNFRHPPSFARFAPALKGTESYSVISRENKELLVNSYDNTILYTDHVLASLIRLVNQQQAASVVVYTSDHGEALYDDEHTGGGHPNTPPFISEIRIPLFVWTSETYDRLYPEKRQNMEKHLDAPLNSSNLFYAVPDLVSLRFPAGKPEKSFASDSFLPDSASYVLTVDERVIRVR